MLLSCRPLRCSILCLLSLLSGVCAAQQSIPQFIQPIVEYTGGQVTSFVPGNLQGALPTSDILYINAAVVSGSSSSVLVGEQLSVNSGQGAQNVDNDQITFSNVSNVVAALADFNHDSIVDYAFALTRTVSGPNLCVYYGTGNGLGGDAYDGPGSPPSQYPPIGGKSGCLSFPTQGSLSPVFSYIAAPSFQSGQLAQLILEDSANNYLYVFSNAGVTANSFGVLTGFTLVDTIAIPSADGAGPIYVGDFDHDGNTDFIVNGQTGNAATVYFGNGDGTFLPPLRLAISGSVHSMLLQDMNGDGVVDLIVENDNGVIQIYPGQSGHSRTTPFAAASAGGTAAGVDGYSGNGGHLAAINPEPANPASLNILTTTPIGLSVLQAPPNTLNYSLKAIYNIGPGRSSYALGAFRSNGGITDLAVDSAEGVAIVLGDSNGDGGFQTSNAYAALAPALGATIGRFRNATNNPHGYLDVAVATGAVQGQLLANIGAGGFATFPGLTNASGVPGGVPANLWSNLASGDFNGDGVADLAYSLTGFPTPVPGLGPTVGPGLYVQFGNGDGTFQPPIGLAGVSNNNLYGETVVADFNGDSIADLANTDWRYLDTLLGHNNGSFSVGLNQQAIQASNSFAPVAAGFFKEGRTSKQDLVIATSGALFPFLNSGNGATFTAMPEILTAIGPSTLLLADVDGDGNDDIVLLTQATNEGSKPNQLLIWWGNGDGTFSAAPQFYNLARNYTLGAVADMNSDGLPDIILSDGQIVSILYNLGNRTFHNDFGTNCNPCGELHFLAGQGINSLTIASVAGSGKPDLVAANGGVTNSNAIVLADNLPGQGLSTAVLTPNPDVNTGGITVLANNITTLPVTGTVTATPNPVTSGNTFTLTATLTPSAGVAVPTGSVEFYINGTLVGGFNTLTAGTAPGTATATYTVTAANNTYAAGTYPISAFYGGDNNNSQTTLNGTLTINATIVATIATAEFCVGPSPTCPAPPAVVLPPFVSTLTMSYGEYWNGEFGVSAVDGSMLTGTINLQDVYNGVLLPVLCSLPAGVAGACPVSVGTTLGTSVGVNVLSATYTGDATHAPSQSTPVTITVLPDTTTATLTSSLNPAIQGQSVTFTAIFNGNFVEPVGSTVQFTEAFPPTTTVLLLGTATLAPGASGSTATFTTSTLPVGTDPITVSFAGNTDFGAASASLNQVINPQATPSFTLSVTPTAVTSGVGYASAITVTVTPQNGFAQTVNLACANLPYEASCTFIAPTVTGGGTAELFVGSTAPHTCGTTQPYFLGGNGGGSLPFALPALAGLLAVVLPGRRRWLRVLVVLIVAAVAAQMTGCGNCTDLGTRPGTYTFQVTGTFAGQGTSAPAETQTVPVTLTVTL